MGVGLTSLGHLWAGRRRPHNNYVIGNPADTTPTAYSVGTAGRRPPSTRGLRATRRSRGGAAEALRCSVRWPEATEADHSGAARVQRFPAPPAADPTGTAGHRAEPRRSCSATTPSRRAGCRPRWGNCEPSAGHGGAAWYYATRHHRLRTFQGTRALVEPRELRAGASTSRRYGPRTRREPRAVRAEGAV
jgi:hypothetical protein